jgi:hypothetical protein
MREISGSSIARRDATAAQGNAGVWLDRIGCRVSDRDSAREQDAIP